jgi:hypothetical protein
LRTIYTQQKLEQAIHDLLGPGTIQERLRFAAMHLTLLRPVDAAAAAFADPDLQRRLDLVIAQVTATASGEQGIDIATRALQDEEGDRIAKEILSLLLEATELTRQERSEQRGSDQQ